MTTTTLARRLTAIYDSKMNPVQLGKPFGAGKEGTVYPAITHPGIAAKILHQYPLPEDIADKLKYMIENPPPVTKSIAYHLAWPKELINRPKRNGRPVGYMMPQIDRDRYREIGTYFNPARRRKHAEQRGHPCTFLHLMTMASSLAHAIAHIHDQGHIIGDLNSRNVLANNRGQVAIIDIDSFQIHNRDTGKIHRCTVGTPEYTPPQLQGIKFTEKDRTTDDDLFALAVMIYQIIFQGNHPFSGQYQKQDGTEINNIVERIKLGTFVNGKQTQIKHTANENIATIWKDNPFKHQFQTAFRRTGARTTAANWAEQIDEAGRALVRCRRNYLHHHFKSAKCTWCACQKINGVEPFPEPK